MTTKTMKRALVASLSAAAVLATAACSSTPAAPGTAAPGGGAAPGGAASTANWDEKGPITYVQGKDTSGNLKAEIDEWNAANPNEQVTFVELSDSADQQRDAMIQRARASSDEYTVMSVDVVWTAEFAANGWLEEMPADKFPLEGHLDGAVDAVTYFNKAYAYPSTSDGGLLYYRKDLLDAKGVQPPKTWAEMKAACDAILPEQSGMSCYAGQHQKYEGLTVNISEAINSAGGDVINDAGAPAVNSPEAVAGVQWMVDGFKSGLIPSEAITWKEEESRQAFQDGKILFLRNWPYVWQLAQKSDGSSKVNGKIAVSPLPGKDGPGVSSLGGHNMGISKFAKNKGTALAFIKWMNSEANQKRRLETSSLAPSLESLYDDASLQEKFPYLKTLGDSIATAKPRPKAVQYGDVTLAIQDATYAALQGQKEPKSAFDELQTKLAGLVKQ